MQLRYVFEKSSYPLNSTITLPYGVKKIKIKSNGGATFKELGYISAKSINECVSICFPIVNEKSPNTFTVSYWSDTTDQIEIFIEELGGRPDPDYFNY